MKKVWSRITGLGALLAPTTLRMSEAEFEAERNTVFDSAKRVSDFVGMIVRLAFLQFVFLFFLNEAPKAGGVFGFALGLCAVSSLGLSIYLARGIMRIVFLWELRDARRAEPAWAKAMFFVFALITTLCIYGAMIHLVAKIASSNALIAAS